MQGITAFIASTVPCTRRDANYAVPALFVSVGLPVLDELVPSLELLLNAPGARANHAVPAVFFEGGGAGGHLCLLLSVACVLVACLLAAVFLVQFRCAPF